MFQAYLDQEIKKICPIEGISFGNLEDKKTWRIDYQKEATEMQKLEAQRILNEFEFTSSLKEKMQKENRDSRYINELLYKKAYKEYLVLNPSASFSDFIDYLESNN